MADLPENSFVKVNDVETAQQAPASEALLQKMGTNENTNNAKVLVNATRELTSQTFTGSGTFNVPSDVSLVMVIGSGGGGGGASGSGAGGAGGGGASVGVEILVVTPSGTETVTIGGGGAGGAGSASGTAGTDSAFGSINFKGGPGGINTGTNKQLHAGANGGDTGLPGGVSGHFAGGIGVSANGGGGGGGHFGAGGAGGAAGNPGVAGGSNTGAGGGGAPVAFAGGAGGSGKIIVVYIG